MPPVPYSRSVHFRFTVDDQQILEGLKKAHGLDATSIIRMAIRQLEHPAVRLERYKNSGKIATKKRRK